MEELDEIGTMLEHEELVPREETENLWWALKAVVAHVREAQEHGYKVDGGYLLWAIKQNLNGRDDELNE